MKTKFVSVLMLCLCMIIFTRCDDKESYYDSPDWLEAPIYSVLEKEGRFSNYLKCVEKTQYLSILKGAGLYTVFAPNDEAFKAYFETNTHNHKSIDDISKSDAEAIVAYSLVFSQWTKGHLADVIEAKVYVPGVALKRKTAYYPMVYKDPEHENEWTVDQNAVSGFAFTTNNYKFLPVFMSSYFNAAATPLTAKDYNTFFPTSTYTGQNVMAGTILKADIKAQNGIIHEVSSVSYPLDNIDRLLADDNSKAFKDLLEFKTLSGGGIFKTWNEIPSLTEYFKKRVPEANIQHLYLKQYSSNLFFSPLVEQINNSDLQSEKGGYTLFVPSNEALEAFIDNKLFKYYKRLDELPIEALSTFVNGHMVDAMIWPASYKSAVNSTGEYINGQGDKGADFDNGGIQSKKIASNGFVYGIDHVIKSRLFETTYSEIFLNPKCALINTTYVNFYSASLREELMKSSLTGFDAYKNTLLLFDDAMLVQDGFTYDNVKKVYASEPAKAVGANVDERLKRLIRSHIFPGIVNGQVSAEVTNFDGSPGLGYNGWGFLVNEFGDMIRFKNNQLQAAGDILQNTHVTVTPLATAINGSVFKVDKMLQYSPRWTKPTVAAGWTDKLISEYLREAKVENPNVSDFVDYVIACLYNDQDKSINGIKPELFYTVLMPNNAAMADALAKGLIDPIASFTDALSKFKTRRFLIAHFLQGRVYADDGLPYIYPVNISEPNKDLTATALRITNLELDLVNQRTSVEVSKSGAGELVFKPQDVKLGNKILIKASTASPKIQRGSPLGAGPDIFRSNRIGGKAVLHEVDDYIFFEEQQP